MNDHRERGGKRVSQRGLTLPSVNKAQRNQRKAAGKKSAIARAARAEKRLFYVKKAIEQFPFIGNPNSWETLDRIEKAYRRLLLKDGFDPDKLTGPPFKVSRETLRSDFKRLGFRKTNYPIS
jgi:hypothetical protein